ncbi:MAG: Fe-S cluster assembly ATPase SufC [bacterium]|nr:Fe-S cluster assembly ATPase SufC [bacterium]
MAILEIKDLHCRLDQKEPSEGKEILKGLNLTINAGEVHAIMGPNGSGKSTLANVLSGKDGYQITQGSIIYEGKNLLEMDPEERAREGVFLAFQYPVELPGVAINYFLRMALKAVREHRGLPALKLKEFDDLIKTKAKVLQLDESFLKRSVNEGFSGGEKKRNEIFQMALLDPKLCLLDETDSGLDIDALQIVSNGVNKLKIEDPKKAFLVITHYQRLLDYIVPDFVHVLVNGRIVRSGDKSLALELEKSGYSWAKEESVSA